MPWTCRHLILSCWLLDAVAASGCAIECGIAPLVGELALLIITTGCCLLRAISIACSDRCGEAPNDSFDGPLAGLNGDGARANASTASRLRPSIERPELLLGVEEEATV